MPRPIDDSGFAGRAPTPAERWRAAWLGLCGLAAAVLLTAWLFGRATPEAVVPAPVALQPSASTAHRVAGAGSAGGTHPGSSVGSALPPVPPSATPTTLPTPGVPGALTRDDIDELRRDLAGRPDAEAELQRIVAYRDFAAHWAHFVERRDAQASPAELRPMAEALDRQLDQRWRRHEVTAAEAALIKSALLDVLQPDADRRLAELQTWRTQGPGTASSDSGATR
jgi:hypothetical protein